MILTPKEKANELVTMHHNIIQDIGGELGQEILVTILAKQCAFIGVDELIESHLLLTTTHESEPSIRCKRYWQKVKEEIEKL